MLVSTQYSYSAATGLMLLCHKIEIQKVIRVKSIHVLKCLSVNRKIWNSDGCIVVWMLPHFQQIVSVSVFNGKRE